MSSGEKYVCLRCGSGFSGDFCKTCQEEFMVVETCVLSKLISDCVGKKGVFSDVALPDRKEAPVIFAVSNNIGGDIVDASKDYEYSAFKKMVVLNGTVKLLDVF